MTPPVARSRVLIVDDEPVARRGLRSLLKRRHEFEVIGECSNGHAAVAAIGKERPDLVLLDVQMPGLDGFGVIRSVGVGAMPCVIFTTAFDEFALRAFEVAAIDYVVKPFSASRLSDALDRALQRLHEHRVTIAHERLLEVLGDAITPAVAASTAAARTSSSGHATRLLVSVGEKRIVVPLSDVTLFQADGYHIRVWAGESRYTLRGSLQDLEARLDPSEFLRVHRSAIVRTASVRAVERDGQERILFVMADSTRIPVSRGRREMVIETLGSIRG
jgi:two-component system, LytTR family, response regulator